MFHDFVRKAIRKTSLIKGVSVLAAVIPLTAVPNQAHALLSIAVSGTVDINFGSLTETGAGGTAVINTAGARSVTGAVTAVTGGGFVSEGVFSLSGSTGEAIEVSMAAGPFTVSNGGGGTMVVDSFNLVTNAGGVMQTITLAVNPSTYPLGATLNVGAAQAEGTYVGNYTLNANYQ